MRAGGDIIRFSARWRPKGRARLSGRAGGGGTSTGGVYSVSGTIGQPDAGLLTGGSYTLAGGFWPGGAVTAPVEWVYLPLVLRSYK